VTVDPPDRIAITGIANRLGKGEIIMRKLTVFLMILGLALMVQPALADITVLGGPNVPGTPLTGPIGWTFQLYETNGNIPIEDTAANEAAGLIEEHPGPNDMFIGGQPVTVVLGWLRLYENAPFTAATLSDIIEFGYHGAVPPEPEHGTIQIISDPEIVSVGQPVVDFAENFNSLFTTYRIVDVTGALLAAYEIHSANEVPLPPSVWLMGSGLLGLVGLRRKLFKA
jgi:hypothetical protein